MHEHILRGEAIRAGWMANLRFTNRDSLMGSHKIQVSAGIPYLSSISIPNQGTNTSERCSGFIQCRPGNCGDYCAAVVDIIYL
mmetsp:Transcript_5124/g.7823  ORF Transcript_5124/g.7823 Transcript_5124/m.7823 type:complete len:83 (+) Transcript_5124:719-967(+)